MANLINNSIKVWGEEEYVQALRIKLSTPEVGSFVPWCNQSSNLCGFSAAPQATGIENGALFQMDLNFDSILPMPQSLDIPDSIDGALVYKFLANKKKWRDILNIMVEKGYENLNEIQTSEQFEEWIQSNIPDALTLGRKYLSNKRKHGYPVWVEWREAHWGVKLPPTDVLWGPGSMKEFNVSFMTPWESPVPALKAMSSSKLNIVSASEDDEAIHDMRYYYNGVLMSEESFVNPISKMDGVANKLFKEKGFKKTNPTFSKWPQCAKALIQNKPEDFNLNNEGIWEEKLEGGIFLADLVVDMLIRNSLTPTNSESLSERFMKIIGKDPNSHKAKLHNGTSLLDMLAIIGSKHIVHLVKNHSKKDCENAAWKAFVSNCPSTGFAILDERHIVLDKERISILASESLSKGMPELMSALFKDGRNGVDFGLWQEQIIRAAKNSLLKSRWLETSQLLEAALLKNVSPIPEKNVRKKRKL